MNLGESYQIPISEMAQKDEESLLPNTSGLTVTVSSSRNSESLSAEVNNLKKDLKFFFKNPIQKWNERRRFPLKFLTQVIKIILVTFQLWVFAQSRYNHMNYGFNNRIAFSHLFLNGWDASREVSNYPPEAGPLAVYTISELLGSINFVFERYKNLTDAIGPYSYVSNNESNNTNHSVRFTVSYYVPENELKENSWLINVNESDKFSIQKFLNEKNLTIDFKYVLKITLTFQIRTSVYKEGVRHSSGFNITIVYDNNSMDGQMLVTLYSQISKLRCDPKSSLTKENNMEFWHHVLNMSVIFICVVSFLLCSRSIYRAQLLKYKTMRFFRKAKKVELSTEGRLEFWNFWYIMIIINDVLIIIGSCIQTKIIQNEHDIEDWNACSLCLGTGNMLVWFGVLRYFGFFKTYNVVMLTLKRAFPKMTRFLLCTLLIYAGFVFCGWLVLGPFHIKFRSISRTSENLFSLVNGDDMFATFTILESNSDVLWWYSRIYLYSFISLFIYVILNLFLSVILDAYETIKEYYLHGFPKSDLHQFISELDDDYDHESNESAYDHGLWCYLKSLFPVLCPWRV